jgi:mRNA interferase RelE/StbE
LSRVELSLRARKEIVDLDWPLSDAVVEALGLVEREPEAGHLLRGPLGGLRSLRVGAYRIIYQLDDDRRLVRVLAVRHRSVAYATISRPPSVFEGASRPVG